MAFMNAEFDRLDTDKSGQLDAKELAQFQPRPGRDQKIIPALVFTAVTRP
jgi:hypothetical protein